MSSWMLKAIRKQTGAQWMIAAAVLLALLAVLVSHWGYVREYFRGAHAVSSAELIAAAPSTKGWIRVQAHQLHATNMQVITVRKKRGVERGRSVTSEYFVAEVGDRLLLVNGLPGQTSLLEGTLAPLDGEAMARLLDKPEARSQIGPRFLPQMIDTHDYAGSANIWLPLGGMLALFAAVWGALGFMRWQQPEKHPVAKKLQALGELGKVSRAVERDMAGAVKVKVAVTTLTPRFAVMHPLLRLEVQALSELLWVYKKVIQKKIYYFIPAGKSYTLCLRFADGTSMDLPGKEEAVDAALAFLIEHAPWAVYGHSDEVAVIFKDKKKRPQLLAHVQQRQETLRAAAATPFAQAA